MNALMDRGPLPTAWLADWSTDLLETHRRACLSEDNRFRTLAATATSDRRAMLIHHGRNNVIRARRYADEMRRRTGEPTTEEGHHD